MKTGFIGKNTAAGYEMFKKYDHDFILWMQDYCYFDAVQKREEKGKISDELSKTRIGRTWKRCGRPSLREPEPQGELFYIFLGHVLNGDYDGRFKNEHYNELRDFYFNVAKLEYMEEIKIIEKFKSGIEKAYKLNEDIMLCNWGTFWKYILLADFSDIKLQTNKKTLFEVFITKLHKKFPCLNKKWFDNVCSSMKLTPKSFTSNYSTYEDCINIQ